MPFEISTLVKSAWLILPMRSDPRFAAKRDLIARAAVDSGWRLILPDYDAAAPVFDAAQTRALLQDVTLVIADLSRARPSCYFELGFAEALGKRVRLIAEEGTDIHQTGARRFIQFYKDLVGFDAALAHALRS